MASRQITFTEATPTPASGYRVRYRPQGSSGVYTQVTGSSSPMILTGLADDTIYEYILESVCGTGIFSTPVTGTFNTYPIVTGTIWVEEFNGPGHTVNLHITLTDPLTRLLQFRWGFCAQYDGTCDLPAQEKCEYDTNNHTDYDLITMHVGDTTTSQINLTAGWNGNCMNVTKIFLWDVSNNLALNLNTSPHNQILTIV